MITKAKEIAKEQLLLGDKGRFEYEGKGFLNWIYHIMSRILQSEPYSKTVWLNPNNTDLPESIPKWTY